MKTASFLLTASVLAPLAYFLGAGALTIFSFGAMFLLLAIALHDYGRVTGDALYRKSRSRAPHRRRHQRLPLAA